jgi:hypothetical protein
VHQDRQNGAMIEPLEFIVTFQGHTSQVAVAPQEVSPAKSALCSSDSPISETFVLGLSPT